MTKRISVPILVREFKGILRRLSQECASDEVITLLQFMRRKQSYLNIGQLLSLPGISDVTVSQITSLEQELRERVTIRKRLYLCRRIDMVAFAFLARQSHNRIDGNEGQAVDLLAPHASSVFQSGSRNSDVKVTHTNTAIVLDS